MDLTLLEGVETEIEKLDILLKAAENWSKAYKKDKAGHAKLIQNEAKYQRKLRAFFRDVAKNTPGAIKWAEYDRLSQAEVKAASTKLNVKTIVDGDFLDGINNDFVKISFNYISTAVATGVISGQSIYKIKLDQPTAKDIIQTLTTDRLAWLVGKRVDKDGVVVDNPNAAYRISDTTRDQIASSIKTSIDLGENRKEASTRLIEIVGDPRRSEIIAQTESVNAYSKGLIGFGGATNATGKESQDVSASDECADYSDMGIVPLDFLFGGTEDGPAYHTGCRCGLRLVYANEYNPDE